MKYREVYEIMAQIKLKEGADPIGVAKALAEQGITMGQRLANGSYVVFINRKRWLCMQFPELVAVYKIDRVFWKTVKKRNKTDDPVSKAEIEAHMAWLKSEEERIMGKEEER